MHTAKNSTQTEDKLKQYAAQEKGGICAIIAATLLQTDEVTSPQQHIHFAQQYICTPGSFVIPLISSLCSALNM